MPWVVDTCNLIDVLEDDPTFGRQSAQALDAYHAFALRFEGLIARNPADFRTAFPDLTVVDATRQTAPSDR